MGKKVMNCKVTDYNSLNKVIRFSIESRDLLLWHIIQRSG